MTATYGNEALNTQYLLLGSKWIGGGLDSVFLTPADAYAIDTKMDDGWPGTGIVLGYPGFGNNNNSFSYVYGMPVQYNISVSTPQFYLLFAVKSW